ncbi:TetR/AcrR family transcriptional regulator C-terminal domain-containing protein [Streptomyces sp. NBC_00201]|uniref:TetR/AcrR family transcriptional regulator n=1 Tax=unclassified Streptomyces TaxID=2593676 RepID=UPI00224F89FF|nr:MULTISPECIES: TetR/AcrR family transcriptional regulator C-terminal domain-containing protein [unclassified Streptomyces]MCX5251253.1 TetR/AcrR family transcriptional regulator C-terminal domain-containing protein [Streptomyces sp. NBC_00201]MCX5294824.1 TetR/AcrR family transcriptional regulator C-terminal domain-containing protein [Streptomyces sp. NBC_00183]
MTDRTDTPRSRRERPAKPALTREGIVAAAVAIMRAEGLATVTMRRLARELDTGPASLYVYVRNTAELHAAVLDELLGTVGPAPAEGTWRERLERMLTAYTATLFEHPSLARSALTARPSGPHYLNLIEALLALLDEGGVPPAQAAWGVDLLLLHATATAAEHAQEASEEEWDALRSALHGISDRTHPHIAALGGELLSGAPESRLSWGLRAVIAGIERTAVPD